MADSAPPASSAASIGLRAILAWLTAARHTDPSEDLLPLRAHLLSLREIPLPRQQRLDILGMLDQRASELAGHLLPGLSEVALPLSRKLRFQIKGLQEVLQLLAEDTIAAANAQDPTPATVAMTALYPRGLQALALHLRISYLVAAPPAAGIWRLLHETILNARRNNDSPQQTDTEQAQRQSEQLYLAAALLASAQPASFTSREIDLAVHIIEKMGEMVRLIAPDAPRNEATLFWADPLRDTPPMANNRVPAPADALLTFDCNPIAERLEHCLAALGEGHPPQTLELPDICATPQGQAVIRRLVHYWGSPGKRRFPRRRQSYRAEICASLPALWRLFRGEAEISLETSSWMITNESPDGYAAMHISGKTRDIGIGDVIALRTESGSDWQICIIRWAMSENPEHLEIGLQVLAPQARPGEIALGDAALTRPAVLVLPSLPPLRPQETIIAAAGALPAHQEQPLILMIEKDNLEIREIRATGMEEQTGSIEIFSIKNEDGR